MFHSTAYKEAINHRPTCLNKNTAPTNLPGPTAKAHAKITLGHTFRQKDLTITTLQVTEHKAEQSLIPTSTHTNRLREYAIRLERTSRAVLAELIIKSQTREASFSKLLDGKAS